MEALTHVAILPYIAKILQLNMYMNGDNHMTLLYNNHLFKIIVSVNDMYANLIAITKF